MIGYFSARRSAIAGALALSACSVGGAPDDVIDSCEKAIAIPPAISTDILFVIDDSASMREEQEKVASELEGFVTALLEGPVAHDFQVGVVTTGVTSHQLRGCGANPPPPELFEFEKGALQGPILHYRDPDFLARFAEQIRQGIEGSPQEMGLEAMRLALTSRENAFLRDGSRLLVVIVSDEDDCSDPTATALTLGSCDTPTCQTDADCGGEGAYCLPAPSGRMCQLNHCETAEGRALLEPVEEYVGFLEDLDDGKGRDREVMVAVIGAVDSLGDPARCSEGTDEAWGVATRYRRLVQLMGDKARIDSICAPDFGRTLGAIAELASVPHTLDVPANLPDPRLLVVELDRADGSTQRCRVGDGLVYERELDRVTLEGECRLRHGDRVAMKLFCGN